MPELSSYSYLGGPLVVLAAMAFLVLALRWTYRSRTSLVARRPKSGPVTDYGLLVPVASPGSYVEGEVQRRTLEGRGVRATLALTDEGPRVMVFPRDADRAREVLKTAG